MKSMHDGTEAAKGFSEESVYTPVFTGAKKISVRLRRKFINLLICEKYDEIAKELSPYTMQQVGAFFIEEGYGLLKHAMLASAIRPLDFILNKIPAEAVKQAFNNKKTDFLAGLLYTQKMAEMRGENNKPERKLFIEKFTRVLQIDPDSVQAFMNAYASNEDYMTPSIAEDYQVALENLQETRRHSLKQ